MSNTVVIASPLTRGLYSHLVDAARSTLDGGHGPEVETEFLRGLVAMIIRAVGLSDDDAPAILADLWAGWDDATGQFAEPTYA